jgi:MFS family permease
MVGVALPSSQADPGVSTSELQWIVSGYVLGHGGFLLLDGRAADILGRRRVFLTAAAVFALASLVGGPVGDGNRLIVARLLKGVIARVRPTRDVVRHHDHRCGARPGEGDDGGGKEPERGPRRRPPQHLLNTAMQIGGAIGLAIVTAVLTAGSKGLSGPDALLAGFTPAMITVTVLASIGLPTDLPGTLGCRTATAQTDKSADHLELDKGAESTA